MILDVTPTHIPSLVIHYACNACTIIHYTSNTIAADSVDKNINTPLSP